MSSQRLDKELVRHCAVIARLEFTEEELHRFLQQFKVILEAFQQLDEVNIENVDPSFHPLDLEDVLREDEPENWQWKPLKNTKHKEKHYFKGPRIT